MKMFNGQVRILTNARHILDLRKNLFSSGVLKAQGCKFLDADRGIKVTKGFMMILKGERMANLYNMIGSVIVGDASATTEKEDTTIL